MSQIYMHKESRQRILKMKYDSFQSSLYLSKKNRLKAGGRGMKNDDGKLTFFHYIVLWSVVLDMFYFRNMKYRE
jgi:hypothetical protein